MNPVLPSEIAVTHGTRHHTTHARAALTGQDLGSESSHECGPIRRKRRPAPDCTGYVMWDAAYVLGSLSADDRREFEGHLGGCTVCRKAVVELSDMPALLAVLDRREVAAIAESSHSAKSHTGAARAR